MIKKTILIISHDCSRTGAPILLLNLAEVLKADYNIHFLLKYGGELENKFETIAKTYKLYNNFDSIYFRRIKNKIIKPKKFNNLKQLSWNNYDLVISNTITNGDLLPIIRKNYKGKIISYIHELEMATNYFTSTQNLKQLIVNSDFYFVPSQAVENHLLNNLNINVSKIRYLPYYIPNESKLSIKEKSPASQFIVGGSGTIDWRKSPDLFINVAISLFKKRPDADISFQWKGATDGIELDRLNYDIRKANLISKISFTPSSNHMDDFFSEIDIFLLTSREDPYPLVVLEAANWHIPTICFEGAGGATEFVNMSDGGAIIHYMDTEAIAEKILLYFDNYSLLNAQGNNAKIYLANKHQNQKYIKKIFFDALNSFTKNE